MDTYKNKFYTKRGMIFLQGKGSEVGITNSGIHNIFNFMTTLQGNSKVRRIIGNKSCMVITDPKDSSQVSYAFYQYNCSWIRNRTTEV